MTTPRDTRQAIQEKYGAIARAGGSSCCGTACGGSDPITTDLYGAEEAAGVPPEALAVSLGCGNPTALAEIKAGDTVLDLGSGGGIDVLLSARRVGPQGRVYGVDMTDEMLAVARENASRAGAGNVEFLKGTIEAVPLPDASVDVVISNCVINLSTDKAAVLREAFRVLRPGGRFAVSDVVVRGDVPDDVRRSMELWIGCVAGALGDDEYEALLSDAGFTEIEVEPWRIYDAADAAAVLTGSGLDPGRVAAAIDGRFMSAFIRARKPDASCCAPGCCA